MNRIIRRLIRSVVLVGFISFLSFGLLLWMPGDFAEVLLIEQMDGDIPSPEALAKFKTRNGFDRPLGIQYLAWLKGALQGRLGMSFRTEDRVWNEIKLRMLNSMGLGAAALGLSLVFAFPFGISAAIKKDTWLDRIGMALSIIGMSVPKFWMSLLLIIVFALHLGWLPVSGYGSPSHVLMPAMAAGLSLAGLSSRFIRGSFIDVLNADYLRTARSKGLPESRVILRHAGRNALIPIVTLIGLQLGKIFDSIVVIETVFAWPGLGRLLVESILSRDYPVIQGCVLVIGMIYIFINLCVDCLVSVIDPRTEGAV